MNTSTIDLYGVAQLADHHFDDWMISGVCASQMDKLTVGGGVHQVLAGAAIVAREACATGYDWGRASAVYARAATELGLSTEVVEKLLEIAFVWADQCLTHWSELVRRFIYDWAEGVFIDAETESRLSVGEFNAIFAALAPDPVSPIGRFLIENDLIVQVDSLPEVELPGTSCSTSCGCFA